MFCEAVTRQDCFPLFTCESDEESNEVMQNTEWCMSMVMKKFIKACNTKWSLDVYVCQATTHCSNILYRCLSVCYFMKHLMWILLSECTYSISQNYPFYNSSFFITFFSLFYYIVIFLHNVKLFCTYARLIYE